MSYLKYARTVHQRYNSRKPCCSARGKRGESTNHPECGLPSIVSECFKCNTDSIECLPSTYGPVILQFRGNIASKKRCLHDQLAAWPMPLTDRSLNQTTVGWNTAGWSSDSEVGFFKSFFSVLFMLYNQQYIQKHVCNLYEFVVRQMPPSTTPKTSQKKSKIIEKCPSKPLPWRSRKWSKFLPWDMDHNSPLWLLPSRSQIPCPPQWWKPENPKQLSTQTQAAPQKIGKKNHVLPSMVDTLPRKSGQSFSRKTFSKSSILNQTKPDQTFRSSILTPFPASHWIHLCNVGGEHDFAYTRWSGFKDLLLLLWCHLGVWNVVFI